MNSQEHEYYGVAVDRLANDTDLGQYTDILLWHEYDDQGGHLQWVAEGDRQEIIDWCKEIRAEALYNVVVWTVRDGRSERQEMHAQAQNPGEAELLVMRYYMGKGYHIEAVSSELIAQED